MGIDVLHKKNVHTQYTLPLIYTSETFHQTSAVLTKKGIKRRNYFFQVHHTTTLIRAWRGAQLNIVQFIPVCVCCDTVLSWQRETERVWKGETVSWVIGRSFLLTTWLIELSVEDSPIVQCLLHTIMCCSRVLGDREKKKHFDVQRAYHDRPGSDFSYGAQVQLYNHADTDSVTSIVFISDVHILVTSGKRLKVRAAIARGDDSHLA